MQKDQFQSRIRGLGFAPSIGEAWESLATSPPQLVFIAPAHDTIPSPAGNAIYVLVERLATRLPFPCAILARWPKSGEPIISDTSHRILYYRDPMTPTWLERRLPWRVKMFVWGQELLHQLKYAAAAGRLAHLLGSKVVVVEDTPAFCPYVRKAVTKSTKVILHQHIDKPRQLKTSCWRRLEQSADMTVFVAEQTRRITEETHGELQKPSSVIYCGVDLDHYSPTRWRAEARRIRSDLEIPDQAQVVMFVGRLAHHKGVAEAAEGFNLINAKNSHMVVVGDLDTQILRNEAYLTRLREAAARSNGRVHLAGVMTQQELPAWYEAADLVIVPSIGSEGLPKVIFEALSMGRPVIASDRGGAWELLDTNRNAWLLTDPANPGAIAATLKVALSHPERLRQMRKDILALDRPKMCEKKMIKDFAEVVRSFQSASSQPATDGADHA